MNAMPDMPEHFTHFHLLSIVYFGFATISDDDLSDSEQLVIINKIGEWMPQSDKDDVIQLNREVFYWLNEIGEDFKMVVGRITDLLISEESPFKNNMQAIVDDLIEISKADGKIHQGELELLEIIAKEANVKIPSDFKVTQN